MFDAILRGRLLMGRLSVADATNLDPLPRRRLRDLAREYGRPAVVIILDVPVEIARLQNRARARIVPPHVLDMHYERFRAARDAIATFPNINRLRPAGYDPVKGEFILERVPMEAAVTMARLVRAPQEEIVAEQKA